MPPEPGALHASGIGSRHCRRAAGAPSTLPTPASRRTFAAPQGGPRRGRPGLRSARTAVGSDDVGRPACGLMIERVGRGWGRAEARCLPSEEDTATHPGRQPRHVRRTRGMASGIVKWFNSGATGTGSSSRARRSPSTSPRDRTAPGPRTSSATDVRGACRRLISVQSCTTSSPRPPGRPTPSETPMTLKAR